MRAHALPRCSIQEQTSTVLVALTPYNFKDHNMGARTNFNWKFRLQKYGKKGAPKITTNSRLKHFQQVEIGRWRPDTRLDEHDDDVHNFDPRPQPYPWDPHWWLARFWSSQPHQVTKSIGKDTLDTHFFITCFHGKIIDTNFTRTPQVYQNYMPHGCCDWKKISAKLLRDQLKGSSHKYGSFFERKTHAIPKKTCAAYCNVLKLSSQRLRTKCWASQSRTSLSNSDSHVNVACRNQVEQAMARNKTSSW